MLHYHSNQVLESVLAYIQCHDQQGHHAGGAEPDTMTNKNAAYVDPREAVSQESLTRDQKTL